MNPTFCTLDGQTPVITEQWLAAALAPIISELREDSAECGEWLEDGEWLALLKQDLGELLAKGARKQRIAAVLTGGATQ